MLKRFDDIVNERSLFNFGKKRASVIDPKSSDLDEFSVPTTQGDKTYNITDVKKIELYKSGKLIDSIDIKDNITKASINPGDEVTWRNKKGGINRGFVHIDQSKVVDGFVKVQTARSPGFVVGIDTIISNVEVTQYEQPRLVKNNYARIYVGDDSINIQLQKLDEILKVVNSRQSTDIEWYQTLGFSYQHDELKTDSVEKNHFTHHSGFDIDKYEFAEDLPIEEVSKLNYIKGAVIFRKKLQKELGFEVADTIYETTRRTQFFDYIEKLEAGIQSIVNFNPVTRGKGAKQGTADIILLNKPFRQYKFKNKIIVADPDTGICYLVDYDNDILGGGNASKIQKNIDKLQDDNREFDIDEYEKISRNIIKGLPKDNFKFVLVSLKKSRTGAQFGKVTMVLKYHFNIDKKNENVQMYESWLSDIMDKSTDFVTSSFRKIRKYFGEIYEKFVNTSVEIEYERNEKIVDKLNKHINLTLIKSKFIVESQDNQQTPIKIDKVSNPKPKTKKVDKKAKQEEINKIYNPTDFGTRYVDNTLFLFTRDRPINSISESNKALKDYASDKVDTCINSLLSNYKDLMDKQDIKVFHNKMVNVVTTAIMGGTNLPIYMVYEYDDKSSHNPFSLHKIKPIKEASQLRHISEMMESNDRKPIYFIEIINNRDKNDNKILYRTMNIFIYNYSKVKGDVRTHFYFKVRFGTNSSTRETFMAESSPPSEGDIIRIMKAFKSFKG